MNNLKFYIVIIGLIFGFEYSAYSQSTFSSERLNQSIIDYVQSKTNENATIEIITKIKDYKFNQKKVKAKFENPNFKSNAISSITISFNENGIEIEKFDVKFKIKEYAKVWTTNRTLGRNSVIQEDDIIESSQDIAGINKDDLLRKDEIIGSKVNRTVQKNSILKRENLAENNLIKSGDKVNLVVQSGAVTIRSTGSALQDASVGQNLRVKRDGKTAQVLQGKVLEDGSVYIGLK